MIYTAPEAVRVMPTAESYEPAPARVVWGPAMAALIVLAWAVSPAPDAEMTHTSAMRRAP